MYPTGHFAFCPRCAAPGPVAEGKRIRCPACHFTVYFNPAAAVVVIVTDDAGRLLFLRRAREPAKGKLGLPGGFVDPDETAEDAARRETREESGLTVGNLTFLFSCTNQYIYRGVTYPTVDLVFRSELLSEGEAVPEQEEVEEVVWRRPEDVTDDELSFPSMRAAVRWVRQNPT